MTRILVKNKEEWNCILLSLDLMNIGLAGGEEEEEGDVIVQSTFTLEIRS